MFKNYKRNLLAVGVFLLLIAFPVVAKADAAILSFSMDRTTVNAGQNIVITVTTNAGVNYVFANVDGTRVNGTRQTGNNWQLIVRPNSTQNIAVIANTVNSLNNAATVTIPVTVQGGTTQPPVTPPPPTGALAIHSITETTADRPHHVQLTVVAGIGADYVWVQFDTNRYRRGVEQTALRTATTRTWVIDFRPARWATQTVQVSANREYVTRGATNRNHALTLAAPYVPRVAPAIQNVTANRRNVAHNETITYTIRTNTDVNYVWLTNVNGTRHNATRTSQTANARTWTITFTPSSTGQIRIYANATNTATGAVIRTDNVTVAAHSVAIVGTPTAQWVGTNLVRVEVVTNQHAGRVWVQLPGGETRNLTHRSGSGTANRVWSEDIHVGSISSLVVHLSDVASTHISRVDRTVNITGGHNFRSGWVSLPGGSWVSHASVERTDFTGNWHNVVINFNTSSNMFGSDLQVQLSGHGWQFATSTNGFNWTVHFSNVSSANLNVGVVGFHTTNLGLLNGELWWN